MVVQDRIFIIMEINVLRKREREGGLGENDREVPLRFSTLNVANNDSKNRRSAIATLKLKRRLQLKQHPCYRLFIKHLNKINLRIMQIFQFFVYLRMQTIYANFDCNSDPRIKHHFLQWKKMRREISPCHTFPRMRLGSSVVGSSYAEGPY